MAGLQSLLEDYRNWAKTQDWKLQKQREEMFGGDYRLAEDIEKWGGGFNPSNIGSGLSGLAGAIKTYHGSPRAEPFSKFSKEFMGSGEGAQAFSKGHYLAERPGIAKTYAEMREPMFLPFDIKGASDDTLKYINSLVKNPNINPNTLTKKAIKQTTEFLHDAQNELNALGRNGSPLAIHLEKQIAKYSQRLNDLQSGVITNERKPRASLYEVSLEWPGARESVDPMSREHFFQWDKAFRNQPQHVKDALIDVVESNPPELEKYLEFLNSTWKSPDWDLKKLIQMRPETMLRDAGLERHLYERGVPGVAFLDQPSRTKKVGDRTYNYVAFGDEIPHIVSHNKPSLLDMLWPKK